MAPIYQDLLQALHDRMRVIANREQYQRDPVAHLEQLKQASSRLDAIIARLPPDADPRLRHFLDRQSFVKAIAWLESSAPV